MAATKQSRQEVGSGWWGLNLVALSIWLGIIQSGLSLRPPSRRSSSDPIGSQGPAIGIRYLPCLVVWHPQARSSMSINRR